MHTVVYCATFHGWLKHDSNGIRGKTGTIGENMASHSRSRNMLSPILIASWRKTSLSKDEQRYFCFGRVGRNILTVRFTYRENVIRIFGAGYRRKGKALYEQEREI